MIFSSKSRTDWRISQYTESNYQFWDRCAWPLLGMLRDHINKWATAMPLDKELLGRLRARKDNRHFASGMFELVFFTACKCAGIPIERIPAGTQSTTDYRIADDQSPPIFLECSLVANAMENYQERRRRAYLIQIIEDMTDFPYHVSIHFEQTGISTIPKKTLHKALHEFVNSEPNIEGNELEFTNGDWELIFYFHPKKELAERTFSGESGFANIAIDNNKVIQAALNEKRPQYYKINQSPYVICLAVDDITAEVDEFSLALIGSYQANKINLSYKSEAFFLYGTEPLNTSVSAVIFCKNIHPTSFTATEISVWHNPFAVNPIPQELFPFDQYYYRQEGHYLYPHTITGSFDIFSTLGVDRERYLEYLQLKYRKAPH